MYRLPNGRCNSPESDRPQACEPSFVITILATMLSGRLIPSRIPRFAGSFTSKVEACVETGGLATGAVLNAA